MALVTSFQRMSGRSQTTYGNARAVHRSIALAAERTRPSFLSPASSGCCLMEKPCALTAIADDVANATRPRPSKSLRPICGSWRMDQRRLTAESARRAHVHLVRGLVPISDVSSGNPMLALRAILAGTVPRCMGTQEFAMSV